MATNHQKQMTTTPLTKRSYIKIADKDEAQQRRKKRMIEVSKKIYEEKAEVIKEKMKMSYYTKKYGKDTLQKYIKLFDDDFNLAVIKLKFASKNNLLN